MKPTPKELLDMLQGMPRHERIVTLRSIFNLSQTDLAEKADAARGTVSTWEAEPESGRCHEPSKKQRIRLGLIFGVPAHVFTDDWGAQPKLPYWKEGRPKPKEHEQAVRRVEPVEEPAGTRVTPAPAGVRRI